MQLNFYCKQSLFSTATCSGHSGHHHVLYEDIKKYVQDVPHKVYQAAGYYMSYFT